MLNKQKENQLKIQANIIRQDIIKMITAAGSGHPGGSLGMTDILTALYFGVLKHNPKKPLWPERDRLILSNGHIVPVRYAAMARAGYFPVQRLKTLRKFGSPLQGHPSLHDFPAMECSSGPLGQGISVAVGMALAAKLNKKSYRVYCLMGDGEINEGQCWEAYLLAAKYKLNNLTVILDRNNIQIDGRSDEVMPLNPLAAKYRAFNFKVMTVNGHNFLEILKALRAASRERSKPTVIIARTIPGKGVTYMENDYQWHGNAPKPEQAKEALDQLNKELLTLQHVAKKLAK
ncbi:MAG TPA: transketolase [Candidatus Komeilibacteria bacterium]|nr:transketolase [Candidatus Komeilibacteria bacterium]